MKYTGQIQDFPPDVVSKMIERQVEQGRPADISIFERDRFDGFIWTKTPEGADFWSKVIANKNFNLFFKRYPRKKL